MPIEVAIKALAVWVAILLLAVVNGALREAILVPRLGPAPGLVLSGVLLSCLILIAAYLLLPWLGTRSTSQRVLIGLGWLFLTLAFEFSFGLLRGKTMAELFSAYAFKDGNIWPLVLAVTAMAPWLAAKLRGWL